MQHLRRGPHPILRKRPGALQRPAFPRPELRGLALRKLLLHPRRAAGRSGSLLPGLSRLRRLAGLEAQHGLASHTEPEQEINDCPLSNRGKDSDITERRRAEAKFRAYRDHLEELVTIRTRELTATNEQLQQKIIDHKRAEEALIASQEYAKSIIESSIDRPLSYNYLYLKNFPAFSNLQTDPRYERILEIQNKKYEDRLRWAADL